MIGTIRDLLKEEKGVWKLTLNKPSTAVEFDNVSGGPKNAGTNHTSGTAEPFTDPDLRACFQPSSKLLSPKRHSSPANVETSIRPLYWK